MSRQKPRASAALEKKRRATSTSIQQQDLKPTKRARRQPSVAHQPTPVPEPPRASIANPNQYLYAFGENNCGQIGLDPTNVEKRKFPALCEYFKQRSKNIIAVAAGGMHSLVLTREGEVFTFGCNDEGALGRPINPDNAEEESGTPGRVVFPDPDRVVDISAGSCHSAALLQNGSVYCWGTFRDGNGHYGLIPGDGDTEGEPLFHNMPVKLQLGENLLVRSIASGNEHMVLLTTDGKVLTFGSNIELLGRPFRRTRQNASLSDKVINLTPAEVVIPGRKKFKDIWCGSSSTFCREDSTDGIVWSFGMNSMLQLGIGARRETMISAPVKTPAVTEVDCVKIAVGEFHCLGLNKQGKVFSWGKPYEGQLGLGEATPGEPIATPRCVEKLTDKVIAISCGHSVSYAVTEKSELYAWGFGENWQLGKGDTDDSDVPGLVLAKIRGEPARKVRGVSGGGQHVLLVADYGLGMDQAETPMDTS